MKGIGAEALKGKGRKVLELGKSRKARITAFAVLLFFVVFSVTGFFILPPYVKKIAVEKMSEQLGRQVILGSILLNPYALSFTLKNFEIKEADGKETFVSCERLYVNLEMMAIIRGGPVINEVKMERPYISIIRTGANRYNFTDLIEKFEEKKPEADEAKSSKPLKFSVSNIQVLDGRVEFDDRPVSTKHTVSQINFAIPFISNLKSYVESFVEPSLSATVNGTPVNFKGGSKVFSDSRETSFDIVFRDIDLPYYLAYAPAKLNVKVPSGKLDIDMKLSYRQFKDRKPVISLTGETRLKDFIARLTSAREDLARIPAASVKDVSYDMEEHKIEIGSVSSENGWIAVARTKEGRLNLAAIVNASPGMAGASKLKTSPSDADEDAMLIILKSFAINGYSLKMTDESLSEPFALSVGRIKVKGTDISTAKDAKGSVELSADIEKRGSLYTKGTVSINPLIAELSVDVKTFPLKPLNPYLAEKAQAILAGGAVSINGNLVASIPGGSDPKAAFRGKIHVNKFSMLDKANAEDFLKWETLYIGDADLRYSPLFVHIREIALTNFYSRIVVNANRTTNLQEVFNTVPSENKEKDAGTKQVAMATSPQTKELSAKPSNIRIDKITLQAGRINFTDNFIKPRFSGNLLEIGGRITGLASDENKMAEIELKGMYERYAPLEITGKMNPLREERYVQIKAAFKDMDMTALAPYSGRYAGYIIEKGKLSFQLDYLIVKNKLDAKNTVFLDQLSFGEKVDSPDATKLPVKLGVALLKDRKGRIDLDIPVSGELDDPKFSVSGVMLKVIINLLVKAATSPFALLGAVFGGGEELSYAEFDYGSATITSESQKKMDTIIKVLAERPGLKVDIIGHADPVNDREGLKRYIVMRKVKAQKLKTLIKEGKRTPSLDAVTVTTEEYPVYLKKAYSEEKFPKPRNIIGMAKSLPVPEMEKLMATNMPVTDDDLRSLAKDRGLAVKDYLLKSKQIEQERLFLVESQTLGAEDKEGAKNSRVDFKLK